MHTSATTPGQSKGERYNFRRALRRALDHHEDASDSARTLHLSLEELVVDDVLPSDDPDLGRAVATLRDVQRALGHARAILEALLEVAR